MNRLLLILLLAFTGLASVSRAGEPRPDVLLLDDFQELRNACDGYRNAFSRAPSTADARRFSSQPGGDRCLKIEVDREDDGFCGAWVHLHNMRQAQRLSIDVTPWNWLSFRVRGQTGGEVFELRVADERWAGKEDALTIGPVTDWLPHGVTQEWQTVAVPFSSLRRLDLSRVASVSFSFSAPGQHTVFIDDLCLKTSPDDATPISQLEAPPPVSTNRPRAMWIWSTAELVEDSLECTRLFDACRDQAVTMLWIQLPYSTTSHDDTVTCLIRKADLLRTFLQNAHARGLQVHALDGSPEYSVRHRHSIPLAVINAVVDFNRTSLPGERFDGVHFDNEPYLLMGWSNQRQRDEILGDLMSLNVECQRRCREATLKFGVDIPFWWSSVREQTGEAVGAVTFNGERKSAAYHCIDQLDNVGIMNYRDQADGADGMLAHGLPLLEYAEQADKASIYMGIETFRYTPQAVWFVVGLPEDEFHAALDDRGRDYYDISRESGLRLFRLSDGQRTHVGVELPTDPARRIVAANVAVRLAQRFGFFSDGLEDKTCLSRARQTLERSQEWVDFDLRPIMDDESGLTFPGFVTTRLMAPKVTFADNPIAELHEETRFAEETFSRFRSYRGFAIHSWESFRRKLGTGVNTAYSSPVSD